MHWTAWDEDVQKGRYNPFCTSGTVQNKDQKSSRMEQAKGTLPRLLQRWEKTYDLLGYPSLDAILENTLDLGLFCRQWTTIMEKRLGQTLSFELQVRNLRNEQEEGAINHDRSISGSQYFAGVPVIDRSKERIQELARKYHPDNYASNPLADLGTGKDEKKSTKHTTRFSARENAAGATKLQPGIFPPELWLWRPETHSAAIRAVILSLQISVSC